VGLSDLISKLTGASKLTVGKTKKPATNMVLLLLKVTAVAGHSGK
jgi:hypothetical protein